MKTTTQGASAPFCNTVSSVENIATAESVRTGQTRFPLLHPHIVTRSRFPLRLVKALREEVQALLFVTRDAMRSGQHDPDHLFAIASEFCLLDDLHGGAVQGQLEAAIARFWRGYGITDNPHEPGTVDEPLMRQALRDIDALLNELAVQLRQYLCAEVVS